MNKDNTVSPAVGTQLLFENERVRVWDLRLAPGESTGLHRHEHDYLYISYWRWPVAGGRCRGKPRGA